MVNILLKMVPELSMSEFLDQASFVLTHDQHPSTLLLGWSLAKARNNLGYSMKLLYPSQYDTSCLYSLCSYYSEVEEKSICDLLRQTQFIQRRSGTQYGVLRLHIHSQLITWNFLNLQVLKYHYGGGLGETKFCLLWQISNLTSSLFQPASMLTEKISSITNTLEWQSATTTGWLSK